MATLLVAGTAQAVVYVDDTPEPSWRVDGRVFATVIVGDIVIVGGNFTNAVSPTGQLVARRHLAAFDLDTGQVLTNWRADAGSPVRALVSNGSSVWVGGTFGRLGGQVRSRVGSIDAMTGAVLPDFRVTLDNNVRALALEGNDLYVGGMFTVANGQTRSRLAKFDATTGALDTTFRASANDQVWALAKNPVSGVLFAAGRFSSLSGASRSGVGAVLTSTGAATGPAYASSARPTLALDVSDDGTRLFGAGGTLANELSAWNPTTGTRVWRVVTMGDNQAVKYYGGYVYVGFHDGYQNDTSLKLLAVNWTNGAVDPDFRPRFDRFWGVYAIDATSAGLVVGGDFTRVSGVASQGWVRFL